MHRRYSVEVITIIMTGLCISSANIFNVYNYNVCTHVSIQLIYIHKHIYQNLML